MNIIVDKRKIGKNYGDLPVGECFELDNCFYIKTNIVEDDGPPALYAVNLSTGLKFEIGKKVTVYPVTAELLIR